MSDASQDSEPDNNRGKRWDSDDVLRIKERRRELWDLVRAALYEDGRMLIWLYRQLEVDLETTYQAFVNLTSGRSRTPRWVWKRIATEIFKHPEWMEPFEALREDEAKVEGLGRGSRSQPWTYKTYRKK